MTTVEIELLIIAISVAVLAIIMAAFVIVLITLLTKIKGIAYKADNIVSNLEVVSEKLKQSASVVAGKHPFMNIVKTLFNNSKGD